MANDIKRTTQYMDNQSFDEKYGENTVELMGEDTINQVLRRLQVDASGNLIVAATISTAGLATSANQTNKSQITQLADASGNIVSTANTLEGYALNINIPDTYASGTLTATGQTINMNVEDGNSTWLVSITGTWTGTINFLISDGNGNYSAIPMSHEDFANINVAFNSLTTVNGLYKGSAAGAANVQVTSSGTWTGTANIYMRVGAGSGPVFMITPLPPGTNVIGSAGIDQTTPGTTNRVVATPYAPTASFVKGSATATNTTSTSCVASAGGSLKNYITSVVVSNTGATTTVIQVQDGSGGTVLAYIPCPAGGGATVTFPVPIMGSAATAVYFASTGSSTTMYVTMVGYSQ